MVDGLTEKFCESGIRLAVDDGIAFVLRVHFAQTFVSRKNRRFFAGSTDSRLIVDRVHLPPPELTYLLQTQQLFLLIEPVAGLCPEGRF